MKPDPYKSELMYAPWDKPWNYIDKAYQYPICQPTGLVL